jgi:hypothetical protein
MRNWPLCWPSLELASASRPPAARQQEERHDWRCFCWSDVPEVDMRYIVAWILGVPLSVIVVWFIIGHTACR